jgi:hypothetical protein
MPRSSKSAFAIGGVMSRLIATGGEVWAHVHENSATGLARNLFWNVRADLEPITLGDEEYEPSLACEWMVWPALKMSDLHGMGLGTVHYPDLVEATIYLGGVHHWLELKALSISRSPDSKYRLGAKLSVDIDVDGERVRESASLSCDLHFDGIIVVPESLFPKPATADAAASVVADFFSLEGLGPPEFEKFRYVLKETCD